MIPSSTSIHLHVFAYINAFVLWLNIIAFAIFQGSDCGAGAWFIFSKGRLEARQREALAEPVKSLWEANETWSVFLVTGIFSAFPVVFYTLVVSFFYPLTVALIALVFFGAAFEFYEHTPHEKPSHNRWMWTFVASCVAIPLLFGDVAGAVASGAIHYDFRIGRVTSSYWTTWLTPFTICVGLFALGICMVLASTFQTVQSQRAAESPMLVAFRRRAIISGAATALLGAIAAGLAHFYAPYLFSNLIGRALPFSLAAVVVGVFAATALLLAYYKTARILVVTEVILILGAWGIAQFPYFVPPNLTIENTSAPQSMQIAVFATGMIGIFLFMPAFYYLIYAFQGPKRIPHTTADDWAKYGADLPFEWSSIFGIGKIAPPIEEDSTRKTASPSIRRRIAMRVFPVVGAAVASALVAILVPRVSRWRNRNNRPRAPAV